VLSVIYTLAMLTDTQLSYKGFACWYSAMHIVYIVYFTIEKAMYVYKGTWMMMG